jgi:hypothetical protein
MRPPVGEWKSSAETLYGSQGHERTGVVSKRRTSPCVEYHGELKCRRLALRCWLLWGCRTSKALDAEIEDSEAQTDAMRGGLRGGDIAAAG